MSSFQQETNQSERNYRVTLNAGDLLEIFINDNPTPAYTKTIRTGNQASGLIIIRVGDVGKLED